MIQARIYLLKMKTQKSSKAGSNHARDAKQTGTAKREKPIHLNMPFEEALRRLVRVKPPKKR